MNKTLPAVIALTLLATDLAAQNYCIPQTTNYCCGYGITSVSVAGNTQNSADGAAGYENFTANAITVAEGQPVPINIQTGGVEPHDVRAWVDANNNGTFEHPAEMVFEALNSTDPSGTIVFPAGILLDTDLRIRISADFLGSQPQPCGNLTFGQAEDYSIRINATGTEPEAGFTAGPLTSCNGIIQFTQTSTGNPTAFWWDFGDGQQTSVPNPNHVYNQNGTYSVTLAVSNSAGADTLTLDNYVHVNISETCDTFLVPPQGTSAILYTCNYVLMDNGGTGNYVDNGNGILSLSPVLGTKVCLKFSVFEIESTFDYVEIYDGPTPNSPLVGRYTGFTLPPDVCSSGPALCIKQVSDDVVNYSGFVAQANCVMDVAENGTVPFSVFPNPFIQDFNIIPPTQLAGEWELCLISVTGKTVYRKIFFGNSAFNISLPDINLPAGAYQIRIRTAGQIWQQKILKTR